MNLTRTLKYWRDREGFIPKSEAEQLMDRLNIDKSPELRKDILYLWNHGYVTTASCTGHGQVAAPFHQSPTSYITYKSKTGDSSWEAGEAEKRGWDGECERQTTFYGNEPIPPEELPEPARKTRYVRVETMACNKYGEPIPQYIDKFGNPIMISRGLLPEEACKKGDRVGLCTWRYKEIAP